MPDEDLKSDYLSNLLNLHEKLLARASDLAQSGPAISLQAMGIYLVFAAVLLRAVSGINFGKVQFDFTTLDLAITLLGGMLLFFGGAYIALMEYRNQVRWYEIQLNASSQTYQKAFETLVEHAQPPTPASRPAMGNPQPFFKPTVGS